ncbi:M57 family metalloprotease [Microbacterium sp. Root53]|uniref:M57 family metalloprotease n=1 Tax=Microbacterium sp. Root53 TaxID=1736553 RepID=UPI000B04D575|nr:M57 family metalloprotease [Microbacterium sp. Root53]
MASGAALWESASSKVDFVYVPSADGSCTTRNNAVLFSVEPVSTTQYIARAFFPSTPARQQNVLIDDSIWSSGSWTPTNIIGHELGHVLGFRHEHTRPESGTCFEDSNWRPLTPYDSASIMHYPQCNGTSDDLSMTSEDRAGVVALYGS